MSSSREYPYPPSERSLGILKGWGCQILRGLKVHFFKEVEVGSVATTIVGQPNRLLQRLISCYADYRLGQGELYSKAVVQSRGRKSLGFGLDRRGKGAIIQKVLQ